MEPLRFCVLLFQISTLHVLALALFLKAQNPNPKLMQLHLSTELFGKDFFSLLRTITVG